MVHCLYCDIMDYFFGGGKWNLVAMAIGMAMSTRMGMGCICNWVETVEILFLYQNPIVIMCNCLYHWNQSYLCCKILYFDVYVSHLINITHKSMKFEHYKNQSQFWENSINAKIHEETKTVTFTTVENSLQSSLLII